MPQNREQDALELTTKANAALALITAGYDQSDVLKTVGLPDMKVALNLTSEPALPPRWTLGLPPPAPAPAVAKPAAKAAAKPEHGDGAADGQDGEEPGSSDVPDPQGRAAAARGRMGFPRMAGTGRLEPDRSTMSSQVNPIKCRIKNEDGITRVDVYDDIGQGDWFSEGVTAKAFAAQMSKVKGPLEVHINSEHEDVFDGIAIGNAIRKHKGSGDHGRRRHRPRRSRR